MLLASKDDEDDLLGAYQALYKESLKIKKENINLSKYLEIKSRFRCTVCFLFLKICPKKDLDEDFVFQTHPYEEYLPIGES